MTRQAITTEAELMRSAMRGTLPRRALIRRGLRAGLGVAAVAALGLTPRAAHAAAAATTSIPPNCIYVCCDGTCNSWKMCLKCVEWPKPKTASVATR
ncbi:MAG: hypothetical protein U0031_10700 [Thermomicrobiales bacterium]